MFAVFQNPKLQATLHSEMCNAEVRRRFTFPNLSRQQQRPPTYESLFVKRGHDELLETETVAGGKRKDYRPGERRKAKS
jgi:hypothetical protein